MTAFNISIFLEISKFKPNCKENKFTPLNSEKYCRGCAAKSRFMPNSGRAKQKGRMGYMGLFWQPTDIEKEGKSHTRST
ncbi:protein of unknown function [Nitrospina watsonii]|uniref:Uncharacterized protein n=1 Tax=Nitrospina watsonii TaxID=1323948 RepID=A0ABN8W0X6_9BACT|nr:protein of unknown function [Nitrospina watsonii]